MVRALSLIFIVLCYSAFAQEVVVSSKVEGTAHLGMPVDGVITITHDRSVVVDTSSFLLGGDPFKVEFLKDVQIASNLPLVISIYNFTIEPQEVGLQELPKVSVTVGGKVYHSYSSTYQVEEAKEGPKGVRGSIVLKIEPLVVGDTPLYPGQRIEVGYRYIFNYSHELTREELPMLEAKGFSKLGGKEAETKIEGKLIHYDVLQQVEAVEPGVYQFAPARIQGRAWKKERFGKKNYAKRESTAESAPITIEVLSFPEEGKPPSFNGAIGEDLSFSLELKTPSEVTVGDKMVLLITIKGNGELASLSAPEVCCQPGFSGFFRTSDLPPIEDLFGSTKTFTVEMRPLNDKITEIPSLEFSYFNPKEKKYVAIQSDPIPLKVSPMTEPLKKEQHVQLFDQENENGQEADATPKLIEIVGNFEIIDDDLRDQWFGTWWVLLIIPLGIGALLLQLNLRQYLEQQKGVVKSMTAKGIFDQAIKKGPKSPGFFAQIHEAFLLRLVEIHEINTGDISLSKLSTKGQVGKVRAFLEEVQAVRFDGKEEDFGPEWIVEAKALFKELGDDE